MIHTQFKGRLVILGFGSIGQGVLPLILRHIGMPKARIRIITGDPRGAEVAAEYGIDFTVRALGREDYRDVLTPMLGRGDMLLNLSVDVASVAIVALCRSLGALYLDTCVEPWAGGYTDTSLSVSQRSNYALRESALALRTDEPAPTALMTHGANPGLVSHFMKQALLNLAADQGLGSAAPADRAGWAGLAQRLGVRAVHIAERDTQTGDAPKAPGEFVNTWSIDGFVGEGNQPAELGWGTHERALPPDALRHGFGCDAAIYLTRRGASTRVRTWTPLAGPIHGFLVTHNEAISFADYYSVRDAAGALAYRPTVHYAYHPCDDAVLSLHELAGRNWNLQDRQRLMMTEITSGVDELGVLLLGHARGAYWFGSRLSIDEARAAVPHNNATSLQVTAAVVAGMVWVMENPMRGVVEADEIDHARILALCAPYLGEVVGAYSDWTPLDGRGGLFPEDVIADDPWQFQNVRVM